MNLWACEECGQTWRPVNGMCGTCGNRTLVPLQQCEAQAVRDIPPGPKTKEQCRRRAQTMAGGRHVCVQHADCHERGTIVWWEDR